jgi:hypothetical protein
MKFGRHATVLSNATRGLAPHAGFCNFGLCRIRLRLVHRSHDFNIHESPRGHLRFCFNNGSRGKALS